MLVITPIPAFKDNYIWLVQNEREVVCIEPGAAAPVLGYLRAQGLQLTQIWITHHHDDHTGGIATLKGAFPDCVVYGNSNIAEATHTIGEGSRLVFAGCEASVWHVPGHTAEHLAYLFDIGGRLHVFCGDTLFSAGCGRLFTGTAAQMYASLQRFSALPEHTLFYPAHEYTAANLRFAAHIEPDNADICAALALSGNIPTVPVTLAHELKINPFLRTGEPDVVDRTAQLSGSKPANGEAVFTALRELKNQF